MKKKNPGITAFICVSLLPELRIFFLTAILEALIKLTGYPLLSEIIQ